ncbi:MAG: hypothetical protein ACRDZ4_12400 [Egibacteraceae bacterium]
MVGDLLDVGGVDVPDALQDRLDRPVDRVTVLTVRSELLQAILLEEGSREVGLRVKVGGGDARRPCSESIQATW